jgi:HEAT repeat protein
MPEEPSAAVETPRRSKTVYVLWGIALALLVVTGVLCWTVVVPVWQVSRVLGTVTLLEIPLADPNGVRFGTSVKWDPTEPTIEILGEKVDAIQKFRVYISLPICVAPKRREAVWRLAACGPKAHPILLNYFNHSDSSVRSLAASRALDIGPKAFGPLVKLLQDQDNNVRRVAACLLGNFRDPAALGPLTAALKDSDASVRDAAKASVRQIRNAQEKKR